MLCSIKKFVMRASAGITDESFNRNKEFVHSCVFPLSPTAAWWFWVLMCHCTSLAPPCPMTKSHAHSMHLAWFALFLDDTMQFHFLVYSSLKVCNVFARFFVAELELEEAMIMILENSDASLASTLHFATQTRNMWALTKSCATVWMLSILKWCFSTFSLRSDKSRMTLRPPLFFGLVNILDTKPPSETLEQRSITFLHVQFQPESL